MDNERLSLRLHSFGASTSRNSQHLISPSCRFLDTLHLLLISHTVYVYAVSGFGNLLALLEPTWYIFILMACTPDVLFLILDHDAHRSILVRHKNPQRVECSV
ncbi:hypothetical protein DICSQDRAFT_54879 [Dichomitus squalens LYAD-421 SS1]|uniref:uncharacterized protein n=1 Tax=Dichomitus squalens (strain LYAD-421) TaxID=732165 RepID=UPI000441516E|nr:uncharacterized protein DICSQDRAFT_54879 [Dichomitus squalens LYAD-421 SS1]EJF63656.1 hypothetical protein DICSQDRAFT_54879 [Dichomitus squalens LYAD-421 SS1]